MKYQVQIKYTNPSHEHVTLRRRVESVTRLVEAANEQEALNRAANQQRSLGFMIKEATVMKGPAEENRHVDDKESKKKKVIGDDNEKTDIASADGVKEAAGGTTSYPLLKKGEKLKPMKMGEGFDPEPKDIAAHLVDKHGKGKVTKDHVDAYERDRDSNKGIDKEAVMKHVQKMSEEVELDEAQKKLKPSYWKAEWRLGTQSEVDKNNKKIFDKLTKTDPVKAAAFHDNLMRMKKKDVKEEVEQTEEGYGGPFPSKWKKEMEKVPSTKTFRGKDSKGVYTSKTVNGKEVARKYETKEEVEQIDELKKSTLASYVKKKHDQYHKNRMIAKTQKQVDWLQKDANKNLARAEKRLDAVKTEEVELSEASKEGKDVMRNMRASLKSMDLRHGVDSDKRDAGYKMSPAVKAAQAKSDALSKVVKRPQAGTLAAVHKSMEREMLKKEAVEDVNKKKARKAAEKMVNKAKGSVNKINITPAIEPGKPNA